MYVRQHINNFYIRSVTGLEDVLNQEAVLSNCLLTIKVNFNKSKIELAI